MVSEDGSTAIVNISFVDPRLELSEEVKQGTIDHFASAPIDGTEVDFGTDIAQGVPEIFGVGEAVGLVFAAIVLIVMLGSLIAAALPIVTAIVGVGVGVTASLAFSGVVDMASVTPVLGVMLGLAVGIDYSLFIVNRHRKQLLAGVPVRESIGLATGTSGTAVVFAGTTVIVALLALNVTGVPFLGLMGTVGAGVRRGGRARRDHPRARHPRARRRPSAQPPRSRDGRAGARRGQAGEADVDPARRSHDARERCRAAHHRDPRHVDAARAAGRIERTERLDQLPRVPDRRRAVRRRRERPPAGHRDPRRRGHRRRSALHAGHDRTGHRRPGRRRGGRADRTSDDNTLLAFQVVPEEGPNSASTERLVQDLRSMPAIGDGITLGVAGQAAINIDISEALAGVLPLYLVVVVGLSLLIMIVVFRSLLVPLIATGGFVLSLFATYGLIVAVFQFGWGAEIIGLHSTGPILSFLPVILVGILFGLAMDYQLFLASGMREAYVHGASARDAVAQGFRAGRSVVTAAALIMVSVFGGFIFSESTIIRSIGFGLAFGVLLDAFVVRMLLMPALMHLLGRAAWWLPRWLDRILPNVDMEGAALERDHPGMKAVAVPTTTDSVPTSGHSA